MRRYILSSYVRQYLKSLFGSPSSLSPYDAGRDPVKFWNFDASFSYVPDRQLFERILRDIGIKRGARVAHPYALDVHYTEMLRRYGASVDSFDLSARSAQRSGARLADAERLVDFTKEHYDHLLAFEPTSLFRTLSGDPIRGILFLASAANVADNVHVLFHQVPGTSGPPKKDFLPFFAWLQKNFGANVNIRRYETPSGYLYVSSFSLPPDSRRELLELARYIHRMSVAGFPRAYRSLYRRASRLSDLGITYEHPHSFLDEHAERVVERMASTRKGRRVIHLLAQL